MAEGSEPPRRAPAGPGTQPCRPVPRVHTFGKGGQALRRDPRAPPAMRGWLYKQDSSGLRLWKRRWFVLVDLCLYYYRDSSEQQVRGGLPLPGYEIRILPAAPRAPRFLFTAEHPGMRTYCLGAETPEELNAWVCALRRGASPLPRSPCAPSLQMPQEPQSGGPPLPPHPCGWCPLWPPAEEVVGPPMPPTHHPPVPPLHPSKVSPRPEEAPARGEPRPMLTPPPLGRSLRELRPPEAATNHQLPPLAGGGPDAVEQDMAANQALAFTAGFSDWLLALEDSDGALPFPGTASPPAANETSPCPRAGRSGHGSEREGVAGRGAPRPIRITLLQASF